MILYSSC